MVVIFGAGNNGRMDGSQNHHSLSTPRTTGPPGNQVARVGCVSCIRTDTLIGRTPLTAGKDRHLGTVAQWKSVGSVLYPEGAGSIPAGAVMETDEMRLDVPDRVEDLLLEIEILKLKVRRLHGLNIRYKRKIREQEEEIRQGWER